jgi:hypothetical protein
VQNLTAFAGSEPGETTLRWDPPKDLAESLTVAYHVDRSLTREVKCTTDTEVTLEPPRDRENYEIRAVYKEDPFTCRDQTGPAASIFGWRAEPDTPLLKPQSVETSVGDWVGEINVTFEPPSKRDFDLRMPDPVVEESRRRDPTSWRRLPRTRTSTSSASTHPSWTTTRGARA